ncbi:MAG: peptide deformylase [Pseudanabaenaceae cyanobacterium]
MAFVRWPWQGTPSVRELGDPVLRQISAPVDPAQVGDLPDRLLRVLRQRGGMGLAAPQLGELQRAIAIASHPNFRYPYAPPMAPMVLLNPVVAEESTERIKDWEGCLSVPGLRGLVPRARWVRVRYQDRQGQTHTVTYEGFVARVFQHELDHLEGKVFVDRVESSLELMTDREFSTRVVSARS